MTMTDQRSAVLTSQAVCERAGCSYRQLDYWVRCGVLGRERTAQLLKGSGSRRRFTEAEAQAITVCADVADLLDGELTPKLARLVDELTVTVAFTPADLVAACHGGGVVVSVAEG